MTPAVGQGPADHQVHMAWQRWARPQVMAVAVNVTAQLVTVWRVAMMLVRVPLLLLNSGRLAMHLALVLPQPLTLALRVAPLFMAGWVAMLLLVLMVMLVRLSLLVGLARGIGGCSGRCTGKQCHGGEQPDGQAK